jgi:hypothetical protein
VFALRKYLTSRQEDQMTAIPKTLAPEEGLRLQSGPGRDVVFKLTGDETRGAID